MKIMQMRKVASDNNTTLFDKSTSIYYKKVENTQVDSEIVEPLITSPQTEYEINWKVVRFMLLQIIPTWITFFLFSFALKYAKLAQINQGCVVALFTINSFYTAMIFYSAFNEKISCSKILGMILMMGSVACLVIESSKDTYEDETESVEVLETSDRMFYGCLSICLALLTPFIWACMTYLIKVGKTELGLKPD
jgi:multidrug transporter EmrE-like cation transporter